MVLADARGGAFRKRHSKGIRESSLLSRGWARGRVAFSAGQRRTTRAPTDWGRRTGRRARPCARRQNVAPVVHDRDARRATHPRDRRRRDHARERASPASSAARSASSPASPFSSLTRPRARHGTRGPASARGARRHTVRLFARVERASPPPARWRPRSNSRRCAPTPLEIITFFSSDDAHPSARSPSRLPLPFFPRPHAGGAPKPRG